MYNKTMRRIMGDGQDVPTVVSAGVTQAGAAAAVLGGMSAQDITMYGGLIVAVIGLLYNVWHTSKMRSNDERLKALAREKIKAEIESLKRMGDD